MKTAWMVSLCILGAIVLGLPGRVVAQTAPDAAKVEMDAAKAEHSDALSKATAALNAAFDAQIKSLNAAGDANSANVLVGQKSEFVAKGTLPQSPLMKQAAADYQQSVKDADATLLAAYDKAIKSFADESNFELGTQARKERTDLMASALTGGVVEGDSSGTIPTPEAIAQSLEASKSRNRQALEDARKAFLDTINQRINWATDSGNLTLVDSLQKAQATATVDGSLPADVKDDAVLSAKKNYDTALVNARTNLSLAYQKAISDYTRARQFAMARTTKSELDSLGLVDPTAPSAMTTGTYQLTNTLPDFLTAKDSEFMGLRDRLGIVVPETNYIRTIEGDLLNKNFTFDVSFYLVKGMPAYEKLPAALVGLGDGTANIANGGPQDSLYLEINPPDHDKGEIVLHRRNASSKKVIGKLKDFDTYVARIQKSGNAVTFTVGTEQSGTLVPVASITIDDVRGDSPYLNDQNSHLFFGSGAFSRLSIGKGPAPATPVPGAVPLADQKAPVAIAPATTSPANAPTPAPAVQVTSTDAPLTPKQYDDLTAKLNDLNEWLVDSGKWSQQNKVISGEGDSKLVFKTDLPANFSLGFHVKVLDGKRMRVNFDGGDLHFGNEGPRQILWLYGDQKLPGNPFHYNAKQEYAVQIVFDGGTMSLFVDGQFKVKGECQVTKPLKMNIQAGDSFSKGSAEFSDFKLDAAPAN